MKLQLAKGVQDIAPQEKLLQNKVIKIIKDEFESFGFAPLETPIIERYETLAAKFGAGAGSDVLKETFKFEDQGKRKLGLRFELTTSLARFVAMNPTLKMPFKRYEMGPNFRDGPIKLGRSRQFWQCDCDTLGSNSMVCEAEQIAILSRVFRKLDFDFEIKINNRKILNGILNQAGIKKQKDAIIAIDKLDKIGVKGVSQELVDRGYSQKQIDQVFKIIEMGVSVSSLKKKIKDEEGARGIVEIEELFDFLKKLGVNEIKYDVSLARGQAYYTGIVVEAFLKNSKITSSIAGGGRYDDMIGGFLGGGRVVPAVGVSFGIVPIMQALIERSESLVKTPAQVLVIPLNTTLKSLEIANGLRAKGINVDFSLKKGVSKNLSYANSLGIKFAIIVGEDEVKAKKVNLRDMKSGDEQKLSLLQAAKVIENAS
jgi:histidyl-tRNA synthetase